MAFVVRGESLGTKLASTIVTDDVNVPQQRLEFAFYSK